MYALFILFTALGASGAAAWHPVAMGILAERMPDKKSFVFGLHFVGGSVTELLAPLCVGLLLVIMDWRNVMQLTVVPTILIGIILFWAMRYSSRHSQGTFNMKDIPEIWKLIKTHAKFSGLSVLAIHSMAIMGIFAMVGLNARYYNPDSGPEFLGKNGGGQTAEVVPTLIWYKDNIMIRGQYHIPIYTYLRGTQLAPSAGFQWGVGIVFN